MSKSVPFSMMKYSHYPLPENYLKIANAITRVKLVVVGKDPFPKAPTGIPFCKTSWAEQLKDNNSGYHVLKSVGVNLEYEKTNCNVPSDLFCNLARKGVVFLNCSYHFLDTRRLSQKDYIYVEKALPVNEPIIRKADNVLLCGEAKILEKKIIGVSCFHKVVHPDIQNRKFRKDKWNFWWSENAIKNFFT